jgi:3-(3-hydroxy-phenyl)propionate hydroxylase
MYFTPRRYPYRPLDSLDHEVVVAGAGPVGLAAALGLARRGIKVILLEEGDSVCYGSRAICLSRHSLEVLDRLGVGDIVCGQALPWTTGRSYFRDVEVLAFDMPHAEGDPHPPMVNISQSALEQALVDAAEAEHDCLISWRHKVMFIGPGDDQVTVTVDTPHGLLDLTTRWLVAADGARSVVRDDLGLRLRGTSYSGCHLIADIHWRAGLPTERRVWFDPPASPGESVILHRQPDDIWRFDCQLPLDADPAIELAEPRLRQRIGTHLDWLGNTEPWTLEWSSVYSDRALSLDDYVHGRVVFAGDAAHLVPIFGVRGLNSGFEDADTLAWTLALVASGTAQPGLLHAYGKERRDAWEQNIAQADLSTLFVAPSTDGYRQTRDAVLALALRRPALRELIDPRQTSATHARTSPLTIHLPSVTSRPLVPGDPLPDVAAVAGGRVTSLQAERGPDFTLLAFGHADADPLASIAVALRSRLAPAVGVGVLVPDDADSVAASLGTEPGEVLVIRPDGLLLARYPSAAAIDTEALAAHILSGGPAAPRGRDGVVTPASLSQAEQVWRALSDALDEVPPEGREAFLTRLVLLLSLHEPDPEAVQGLVAEALDMER